MLHFTLFFTRLKEANLHFIHKYIRDFLEIRNNFFNPNTKLLKDESLCYGCTTST